MKDKKEILSINDVRLLVDCFYDKIREDNFLSKIFNDVIEDRWPEHLEKMYCFWQTVLLEEHTYHGSPFLPHANLPVEAVHFGRWLKLFHETIDKLFVGKNALKAKKQGQRMAEMFHFKIDYSKTNPTIPLL